MSLWSPTGRRVLNGQWCPSGAEEEKQGVRTTAAQLSERGEGSSQSGPTATGRRRYGSTRCRRPRRRWGETDGTRASGNAPRLPPRPGRPVLPRRQPRATAEAPETKTPPWTHREKRTACNAHGPAPLLAAVCVFVHVCVTVALQRRTNTLFAAGVPLDIDRFRVLRQTGERTATKNAQKPHSARPMQSCNSHTVPGLFYQTLRGRCP